MRSDANALTRVFNARDFKRFARRESIDDARLCEAIERAERGLIYTNLGVGVIMQRLTRPGTERSGGQWTLIAYQTEATAVFSGRSSASLQTCHR
jgi:hypothetical protein